MPKKRTTIVIDEGVWVDFVTYVLKTRGTTKRTSEELEKVVRDFLRSKKVAKVVESPKHTDPQK